MTSKLQFDTKEEASDFFKIKTKDTTDTIYRTIKEGLDKGSNSVNLFEIFFSTLEHYYEVSLPKSQWKQALEKCLEHYEDLGCVDECIDTYLAIKALNS